MKVALLGVGQTKSKEVCALCAEYEKRLSAFCEFECKFIRPYALSASPTDSEIRAGLDAEAQEVLKYLNARASAYRVALCVEGKELDSPGFARVLESRMQTHSGFVFVIGSSYGLSEQVKSACDLRLSLSRMTLPHELCRLTFTEQLYRAFSILHGNAYHK